MKKYIGKIVSVLLACGVIVLLANVSNGNIRFSNKPDALTSATVKKQAATASLAGVEGNFIVLINTNAAPTKTAEFFEGKAKKPDGLVCGLVKDDEKAKKMLDSLSAKKHEYDDALLLLSKAEYGDFGVIVMSKKLADTYTAKSLYDKDYVSIVEIRGS